VLPQHVTTETHPNLFEDAQQLNVRKKLVRFEGNIVLKYNMEIGYTESLDISYQPEKSLCGNLQILDIRYFRLW